MHTHWEKCLDPRDSLKKRKPWQREVDVTRMFREHEVDLITATLPYSEVSMTWSEQSCYLYGTDAALR